MGPPHQWTPLAPLPPRFKLPHGRVLRSGPRCLLDSCDETFAYFYAFFQKDALATGFLDRALAGSREYAAKLGDELKENVYETLRLLAEGLLKCPDNHLDADQLEEIRANTFVLIYRILFLFYAEDRELLPMDKADYRDAYSLRNWAREIARQLDLGRPFSPTAYNGWHKLSELCRIVNEGDVYLGVPPYNGGLFDPEKHPLLVRWKIGDQYLVLAIDKLARAEASGRTGRGPVSYRDLDIRHLGSIYEGLLEHRLRQAREDIAVVKEKDRELFVPKGQLAGRRSIKEYKAGEVYLETDKGERKATGSYYTPDYIVKYIVENTLGPLIEEKRQAIAKEREELEGKLKKSRGYDRDHYQRRLAELDHRLIREILSIKVLDPAMGSGHFLVEAVDYLARELIKAFGATPDEMEEEEIRWARREVVERCIYGVDVNPLAVELAKLSLWIETVAKDRPLSFLDHHLRLGNSLIGAWVKDLGQLPPKGKKDKAQKIGEHVIGLFEGKLKERLPVVLGEVVELLRKPSEKVEDIREKEALYDRILSLLRPFKEVANAWTSTYFGCEVDGSHYEEALLKLSDPPAIWEGEVRSQPWFEKAQGIAMERHFFHWELEFPEVFFEETGQRKRNPGFDAVIGNPPYINAIELNKLLSGYEKPFWREQFVSASGAYDIYILFIERGLQLVAKEHLVSFITPNKFLSAPYAIAFRQLIGSKHQLVSLCNWSRCKVFEDPAVYPVVSVFRRTDKSPQPYIIRSLIAGIDGNPSGQVISHESAKLTMLPDFLWSFLLSANIDLVTKISALSESLHRIASVQATSTAAEADAFSEAIREGKASSAASKLINTGLIDRYDTLGGIDLLTHKGVSYKQPYLDLDRSMISEMRRNLYRTPKVIFAKIAPHIEAFPDLSGEYASINTNCVYNSRCALTYVCALLNSRLLSFIYAEYFGSLIMSGGYFQFQAPQLEVLPIRRVSFTTAQPERARLVEEGKRLYRVALERTERSHPVPALFSDLLVFVEERLKRIHPPATELVRKHNADPLNKDWQIPEGALWEQSDVVHDLLAFLAEEMIRLNEEKQQEMKNFLSWLEAELEVWPDSKGNTGIEALTGKTQLKNYLGDYQKGEPELPFDEFWKILQKNKTRIGRNLTHEFMAELREAYERSLSKLLPIKERLRLTDALIDQIVYRLYGLTPEEIKIVESAERVSRSGPSDMPSTKE
ncbi:MAG: Eco57I restriction-modification methylase domain-containing protein [Candidatus Bipolaricaulis anaerobius]|nr:Eco57I restriction-modification methylase domain-containing protein [Candidatus Bipolaricaulis anaerobius]